MPTNYPTYNTTTQSTRIATILSLLLHGTLFPDHANALLSSRRPISRPGINIAAGTHDILKMALTTNVRPAATDFFREMTMEMHMNYVATLEQHSYNISLRREANKNDQEHHLTKRQILAFGAALLGGGFGVYNTIQIKQIRAETIKAAAERKIIAHAVTKFNGKTDKLIKKADDFLICPPQDKLYNPNRVTKGQHAARCLYALKRKWEEDVEKHCAMTLIQEEEHARRISANQFAMFSTSPAMIEIACKDESTHSKRVKEGLHLVTLPKNCIAETSSLYMQPTFDIKAGTESRDDTILFPASIKKLTNATETSLARIEKQLKQVITHAAPTPALDWLNEHIDQIGDATGLSTEAQASIGTGVVIISSIAAAGLYCYCARKCANKKAQRNQTALNLGYPTNTYPDRPPNYAYPGNTPSPNPNPPQNPHLPRTRSGLDLLKQAEEVQRQKR